ncbi:hypothetical protein [Microcoleus sp. herbarium2]|uniref:hypothetical protein n=1 Tax=Microcoleus sp. herbarium2 TaxID=3055433 RepID=UPI002FD6A69B
MLISDLNHVEVVSEETETSIVGGAPFSFFHSFSTSYVPPAAFAGANGPRIYTSTSISAYTRPGSGGSSSGSSSSNVSYWWY